MEPDDTIDAIRIQDRWSASDVDRLRALTHQFSDDPYLWDILGDVYQMTDISRVGDDFALQCYLNAVAADPEYGSAHNSLGYWYDIAEDYDAAKRHFELAIKFGVGDIARMGLAKVLAQMGLDDLALTVLNECEDGSADDVAQTRREIADGLHSPLFEDSPHDNS